MKALLIDFIFAYFLKRKAPENIPHDYNHKHLGYWMYVDERPNNWIIIERVSKQTYRCLKVKSGYPELEEDEYMDHTISLDGPFKYGKIWVSLFYNGLHRNINPPHLAFFIGFFKLYVAWRWSDEFKSR